MAFSVYPVQKTKHICSDYTVKLNGMPVALNTARVSAVPFNRRWPGHQREMDQTELINFLSFQMDGPVQVEVIPHRPFENVVIRPVALGIVPTVAEGVITFTLEKPAYITLEPYGRNHALHLFADPVVPYPVPTRDETVLYFGPGEHDVGQIILQSGQTMFIDQGAVVYGCVSATDAENIKILGRGILDNSRNHARILFEHNAENNQEAVNNAIRQHTIQLEYCTHVQIEGITIRDSLVYNIRPVGCKDLHISNVKIIGCWRYNSDGIDMHNCQDVLIENCFLRTFDDSICVKGFDCYYDGDVEQAVQAAMYRDGKAYDRFQNTLIRNCTIWNDWGKCLEIGAETRAEEISGIRFEDCHIIHVTGSVLDCCNVDYADVHDVAYRNIHVEFDDQIPKWVLQQKDGETYRNPDPDYAPALINIAVSYHPEYSAGGSRRGINRNITFQNIHLYGRQCPRLVFRGFDEQHQTRDVLIEDLYRDGELLELPPDMRLGEYTHNIQYRASAYEQMEKNTVAAAGQLEESEMVRFFNPAGKGKRIMFVGNSITLHGAAPEIGWDGEWGMAASKQENDYVHRLMRAVSENTADPVFCICQVAEWERQYKKGGEVHMLFENACQFRADIIILRFIENCPKKDFDPVAFQTAARSLLQYIDPTGKAKLLFTTGFWRHPGDAAIAGLAKALAAPLVELGDLGQQEEMKAIGLFDHPGVANHPGDLGMETIANRIWEILKKYI